MSEMGTNMDNEKTDLEDKSDFKAPHAYGRVLIVTAHPDDPEFLFGATIAKLVEEGAEVRYLICTNGAKGSKNPELHDEEVISIRYAEQRKAAELLGVREVTFLGFPDGRLAPSSDLRKAITIEVRRFKPDLILTNFPRRAIDVPIEASHPDHLAAGEATFSAVCPDAINPRIYPELLREGLEPHRVKEIWVPGYEQPNHFVDATPFLEKKVKAILCHKSQMSGPEVNEAPAWVYAWMSWSGAKKGYKYAEEFRRIET